MDSFFERLETVGVEQLDGNLLGKKYIILKRK